jgi:hypothetical protein
MCVKIVYGAYSSGVSHVAVHALATVLGFMTAVSVHQ